MSNILITKTGRIIEVLSGGSHEQTCLAKLHCTLTNFIRKQNGVRMMFGRRNHVAIEAHDHLTSEQLLQVNRVMRQNEVYSVHTYIKGKDRSKNSFRPIKGLSAELR